MACRWSARPTCGSCRLWPSGRTFTRSRARASSCTAASSTALRIVLAPVRLPHPATRRSPTTQTTPPPRLSQQGPGRVQLRLPADQSLPRRGLQRLQRQLVVRRPDILDRAGPAPRTVHNADISAEIAAIYDKPIEQWDDEEITRGRPRSSDGTFRGRTPSFLTPALQAERQRRLRQLMTNELGTFAADALRVIHAVVMNTSTDNEASVKHRLQWRVRTPAWRVPWFGGGSRTRQAGVGRSRCAGGGGCTSRCTRRRRSRGR